MKLYIAPERPGPRLFLTQTVAPPLILKGGEASRGTSVSLFLDLVKGDGEGSRGGNVVGHTSSGKPIYMTASKMTADVGAEHSSFTAKDHADANRFHEDKVTEAKKEGDKPRADAHQAQATAHWRLENHKNQEAATPKKKDPMMGGAGAGLRGQFARSLDSLYLDVGTKKANPHRDPSVGQFIAGGGGAAKGVGQKDLSGESDSLMEHKS